MRREEVEWRKASKAFSLALTNAASQVSDFAVGILAQDADEFLIDVGGTGGGMSMVPYYTGNMLDSVGVRILKGNTLMRYRTMTQVTYKHATEPQTMKGVKNIWGEEEIMRRINRPSRRTSTGIAAQLIVGVPYAESVDQKQGYFQDLSDAFTIRMRSHLDLLKKRKFIAEP